MMPRAFLGAGNSPAPPQTHHSTRILVQTDFFQVLKIFGPHMPEIDLVGAPHGTPLLFFYRESIAFTSLELMWKSYTKILKNKKVRAENRLGGNRAVPPQLHMSVFWCFKTNQHVKIFEKSEIWKLDFGIDLGLEFHIYGYSCNFWTNSGNRFFWDFFRHKVTYVGEPPLTLCVGRRYSPLRRQTL